MLGADRFYRPALPLPQVASRRRPSMNWRQPFDAPAGGSRSHRLEVECLHGRRPPPRDRGYSSSRATFFARVSREALGRRARRRVYRRDAAPDAPLMRDDVLALDAEAEIERIAQSLRAQVLGEFRRRGAVVGLSGGIDSSVVAALCVRAFGKDKVLGLFMPERDSSDDSLRLGRMLAEQPRHRGRPRGHRARARRRSAATAARTRRSARVVPRVRRRAGNASSCCRRSSRASGSTSPGSRCRARDGEITHRAPAARRRTCSSSPRPTTSSASAR